ncbi:MAG: hypothetical protein ACI4L6_02345 [Candidatus Onthoplasma sp.]
MKKICSSILIVLSMLCCMIFSACKPNYSKLEMSFFCDGKQVSEIELIKETDDTKQISIRFSGIKEKDIGQVVVYATDNLASVTDYVYSGDILYVTVVANQASSKVGKLVATHIASNKSFSVDLKVQQKASDVRVLETDCFVAIPDSGENDTKLDLLKLYQPVHGTDAMYFGVVKNEGVTNVSTISDTTEIGASGFKVNSKVTDGATLKIYPIAYLENYDGIFSDDWKTKYANDESKYVTIHFVKNLSDENIVLSTDPAHEGTLNTYTDATKKAETFYLLANNTSTITEGTGADEYTYSLNGLNITAGAKLSNTDYGWEDNYNLEVEIVPNVASPSDKDAFEVIITGNSISIVAITKTQNPVEIKICYVPKYVGELETISTSIKVKGEEHPSNVQVTMEGKVLDVNANVHNEDIFSLYNGTRTNAIFKFEPYSANGLDVFSEFKTMQIVLDADVLNKSNLIYTKDGTELTDTDKSNIGTARSTLNFLNLKFYYNDETKKCISERFTSEKIFDNVSVFKQIYVSYSVDYDVVTQNAMSFEIQSVYNGTAKYLQNSILTRSVTMNLTGQIGIRSSEIHFYTYVDSKTEEQSNFNGTAYLDKNKESQTLLFRPEDLKNGTTIINSAKFNVEVKPKFTPTTGNLLKLSLWSITGTSSNDKDSLEFDYNATEYGESIKYIKLIYNGDTEVGEYEITLTQTGSNYTTSVTVFVYKNLDASDFTPNLAKNDLLFENKNDDEYIYSDYETDYIIPEGSQIECEFKINEELIKSGIVLSETPLSISVTHSNGESAISYASWSLSGQTFNVNFNKSLVNESDYITVQIKANYKKYSLTGQDSDSEQLEIYSKTFFVYNRITSADLKIAVQKGLSAGAEKVVAPSIDVYAYNQVGAYEKDNANLNFSLSVNNQSIDNWLYFQEFEDGGYIKWEIVGDDSLPTYTDTNKLTKNFELINGQVKTIVVYATVKQFGVEISTFMTVYVKKPVITNSVSVSFDEGVVNYDDENEAYINLKIGQEISFSVENSAGTNIVSNPNYIAKVVSENGEILNGNFDLTDGKIKLNEIPSVNSYLLVFAKDALREKIDATTYGFDYPENFLMNGYKNAYANIKIVCSSGTEENPFLIKNADDFWEIAENENLQKEGVYFKLTKDVDLSRTTKGINTISNFAGTIYAESSQLRLTGIQLTNNMPNLFGKLSGTIKNVTFEVNYSVKDKNNVGLIAENYGNLEDVSVVVSGSVENAVVFGGLVAKNYGEIKYTTNTLIGVSGTITFSGTNEIIAGGLVGINGTTTVADSETELETTYNGTIFGQPIPQTTLGATSGDVTFAVTIQDQGYTSTISIICTNTNSTIGGIVGQNNVKLIKDDENNDIYAVHDLISHATISGGNNVGGVIGKNTGSVSNLVSSAEIKANDNVGGIVGVNSGKIYNARYQILEAEQIQGNTNVGGIVGLSTEGEISFCSVMSYRFKYDTDSTDFNSQFTTPDIVGKDPDIVGKDYVAGIVGKIEINNQETQQTEQVSVDCIVSYCSVNAYISATSNISAIANTTEAIVNNVYFIGKLSDENAYYTLSETYSGTGYFITPTKPASGSITGNNWGQDDDINGGNSFITLDTGKTKPIFDVQPTSLTATVKEDSTHKLSTTTLWFDYYDFHNASTPSDVVSKLNENNNEFEILDLLSFTYEPSGISSLNVRVSSNNESVVSVSNDGKLHINGVGHATLTFSAVLDESVKCSVDVYVKLPVGTISVANSIQIAKDMSKQLVVESSGKMQSDDGKYYSYATTQDFGLTLTIPAKAGDFIKINGKSISEGTITINEGEKVVITAIKSGFDGKITLTPFQTLNGVSLSSSENKREVQVKTSVGATKIEFNSNGGIVYPTTSIPISATIYTDTQLIKTDDADESKNYNHINVNVSLIGEDVESQELTKNTDYQLIMLSHSYSNEKQYVSFEFKFLDDTIANLKKADSKITLKFEIIVDSNNDGKADINLEGNYVEYTLLPAQIQKLEMKNYIKVGENWENKNVLEQATATNANTGRIVLDIVPNIGYYDYIEIEDITGGDTIYFEQYKAFDGHTVENKIELENGNGIRLKKLESSISRIYVATAIDRDSDSRSHIVQARAYVLVNGVAQEITSARSEIEILTKMLPNVTVALLKPDNTNAVVVSANNSTTESSAYVAKDSVLTFKVSTEFTTELTQSATAGKFSDIVNGYQTLDLSGIDSGTKITAEWTAKNQVAGLEVEQSVRLDLTVIDFMVYGITMSPTVDGKSIYGNIGKDTEIKAIFGDNDVVDKTSNNDSDTLLTSINSELLNYITFVDGNGNDVGIKTPKTIDDKEIVIKIQANDNKIILSFDDDGKATIKVENGYDKNIKLKVAFNLKLNGNKLELTTDETDITVEKTFNLDFNLVTSAVEPTVITSEEDFLQMESNDYGYYILGTDLTFNNYVPIDVKVAEFDGNGRKITINSFDTTKFEEENIVAGLFKQVYEGMIVKNLEIVYILGGGANYIDLTSGALANYSSLTFAGLTPTNSGIITNCYVSGNVSLTASAIYKNLTSRDIDFVVAGLVGTNETTGYITNCESELDIYAQANIAGFVYSNLGTIASCDVYDVRIDAYNYSGYDVEVKVAGFVVNNSGSIRMSYMESGKTDKSTTNSVNESAGFVFSNTGTIENCYSYIDKVGNNNSKYSGFVFENSGTITTSYSYVNNSQLKTVDARFAFATTGLRHCLSFVSNKLDATSTYPDKLTYELDIYRGDKAVYEKLGFTFGDNETAVWIKTSGNTYPQLVSTMTKVRYFENKVPDGGLISDNKYKNYYGLNDIYAVELDKPDPITGYTYKYVVNYSTLGTKENPFLLHNYMRTSLDGEDITSVSTWEEYFSNDKLQYTAGYYRVISDIDNIGTNPSSSKLEFRGNIQGNGMTIEDFLLTSKAEQNSMGLFAKLSGINASSVENTISNLILKPAAINATQTQAVGALAGISENFNLYNIKVEMTTTLTGRNAVGGLVGLVIGDFNIDNISSNVSVNNSFIVSLYQYDIYNSKAVRKTVNDNLDSVYYAGSVFGIVDGYDSVEFGLAERNINSGYFKINNVKVEGAITVYATTSGGAFGFVGERVHATNVNVNLQGANIAGIQYSGAVVGENRGVIDGVSAKFDSTSFADSYYVSAGIVGFNLGGLINNATSDGTIKFNSSKSVVAGIVGRNVAGVINNSTFNGDLLGYVVGGIIAQDYSIDTLINASAGSGCLTESSKNIVTILGQVTYVDFENYSGLSISGSTLTNLMTNRTEFYTYSSEEKEGEAPKLKVNGKKLLGLMVGLCDDSSCARIDGNFSIAIEGAIEKGIVKFEKVGSKSTYYFHGKGDASTTTSDLTSAMFNTDEVENGESYELYEITGSGIAFDLAFIVGNNSSVNFGVWGGNYTFNNLLLLTE